MFRIVTVAALVLLAAACSPGEPQPGSTSESVIAAVSEGTGEPASTAGDEVDPDDAMSSPAILSVSADSTGTLYLDGRRRDETLPAIGLEVAAGWHHAQVLYDGGRLLSAPQPAHLEPGRRVAVRVSTPFDAATHAAAAEGSGAAPFPSALDPVVFELPPPPSGSGDEPGENDVDAGADVAAPADGSGAGATRRPLPLPIPSERAGLIVASNPPGELFIDGYATGLQTPTNVHIPPGTYRFQVVHEGRESLSRSLSAAVPAGVIRRLDFYGTADFIMR